VQNDIYLSLMLIGLGGVAAGAVGIALPPGERLTAALALVFGAGVGLAILAAGYMIGNDTPEQQSRAFLIASVAGLIAVLVSLAVLWRRGRAEPSSD
jgi:hypothetical protein